MIDLAIHDRIEIKAACSDDLPAVKTLFRAYAESLEYAICFEGFEAELNGLPGDYVAPGGGLWLARVDGNAAGVIALRRKAQGVGEIKRLWVEPDQHGHGLGRLLVETALAAARAAGYSRIDLETLERMQAARALYGELGFRAQPVVPGEEKIAMRLVP